MNEEKKIWKTLAVLCFILFVAGFFTDSMTGFFVKEFQKPKVEIYARSQCIHTIQTENSILPVIDLMQGKLEFKIYFIGIDEEKLRSLNGPEELKENLRQLCIQKYFPKKLIPYILCQNKNVKTMKETWQQCAGTNAIKVDTIRRCINSAGGQRMLSASFKRSQNKNLQKSPVLYLGNKKISSKINRMPFKEELCKTLDVC